MNLKQSNFSANPYLLPNNIEDGERRTEKEERRTSTSEGGRDRVTSAEPLRKCLLVTRRVSRVAWYRASRQMIISFSSSY